MITDHMPLLFAIYAGLFGIILGSFLNVCIYRLPQGQSIVVPRSYCPSCGRFLRWYDNIPILSYLWLKGQCRNCHRRIPIRYFLVEVITGFFSVAIYWKFGGGLPYLFYFVLLAAPLITITFIDLQHQIIPDVLSIPGIVTGILYNLLLSGLPITAAALYSLLGILVGGGSLFLVSWVYEKLRHQEGIGGGDVKLAAMLGAFFGYKGILVILLLSSLMGSVTGLLLLLFFRGNLKTAVPYGPFLAGGALLHLFFGNQMIHWYLGILFK